MKTTLPLVAAAGLALATLSGLVIAAPASDTAGTEPLRPVSACLDITRVNELYVRNERSLIARSGPHHFRIDLKSACPRLGVGGNARLVSSSAPDTQGRMCGDIGEKVVTVDGLPCAVKSVSPIDAETFATLEKQALEPDKASTRP